jgi:hypothetical protein
MHETKRGPNQHTKQGSSIVPLLISIESEPITCKALLRKPALAGNAIHADAGNAAAASASLANPETKMLNIRNRAEF